MRGHVRIYRGTMTVKYAGIWTSGPVLEALEKSDTRLTVTATKWVAWAIPEMFGKESTSSNICQGLVRPVGVRYGCAY